MMKKLSFTTVLFVFLLFIFNGIQGQTTQTQLDQVKLMQRLIGTWQTVINKDTTVIAEYQQYGGAFLQHQYLVVNGKKSLNYLNNFCFSPQEGIFKGFAVMTNGGYGTWIGSFVSENKFNLSIIKDFNQQVVYMKSESTLVSPKIMTSIDYNPEGVKLVEYKSEKIK